MIHRPHVKNILCIDRKNCHNASEEYRKQVERDGIEYNLRVEDEVNSFFYTCQNIVRFSGCDYLTVINSRKKGKRKNHENSDKQKGIRKSDSGIEKSCRCWTEDCAELPWSASPCRCIFYYFRRYENRTQRSCCRRLKCAAETNHEQWRIYRNKKRRHAKKILQPHDHLQCDRTKGNSTDAPDENFAFTVHIGNMSAKQRQRHKRYRLDQTDHAERKRIVRHTVNFIADGDLLNHAGHGQQEIGTHQKPKFRKSKSGIRIMFL